MEQFVVERGPLTALNNKNATNPVILRKGDVITAIKTENVIGETYTYNITSLQKLGSEPQTVNLSIVIPKKSFATHTEGPAIVKKGGSRRNKRKHRKTYRRSRN